MECDFDGHVRWEMGDVIGESYVMKRGGKMKSDEE